MKNYVDLSVVMITMNEELAIKSVLIDIEKFVPGCEILIVDSSTDKTPEIAKKFKGVRVIRQFPPIGYNPAMGLALRSAANPIIVTLDCDNTYPAVMIPKFYEEITNGYEIVDGSRLKSRPKNMPILNYFANLFFARIASLLFLKNIKDLHSGMRAYSKNLISQLSWNEKAHALPVELLLNSIKQRARLKIIYIDYHLRLGESKMNPISSAYWTMRHIISAKFFVKNIPKNA